MGVATSLGETETDYKWESSTSELPSIDTNQLEPFEIVRLTPRDDEIMNNENLSRNLSTFTTSIRTFHDSKACEKYLKAGFLKKNILLIVNSNFAEGFIRIVHDLQSIVGIFIVSSEQNDPLLWSQNYSKIRSIIYNADGLIYELLKDQIFSNNLLYSKHFQILKKQIFTRSSCVDVENDSFICFILLLTILTSESDSLLPPSCKRSFQNLHRYYRNTPETSKLIKQLEENYKKDGAIKTLLNNTTLARFLDKALYEQNIPVLFHSRFILVDIYKHQLNHRLSLADTYTTQIMSFDDLKKIDSKAKTNHFIMFKRFLLTSTDPLSLPTMNVTDKKLRNVLLEIHAEDKEDTFPFACVEENLIFGDNRKINSKILFMPGSIFQIKSLEQMTHVTWKLKLNLVGHNEFKILVNEQQKLRTNNNPLIVSDLFNKYGQFDKAIEYRRHLLLELPKNQMSMFSKVQFQHLNIKKLLLF